MEVIKIIAAKDTMTASERPKLQGTLGRKKIHCIPDHPLFSKGAAEDEQSAE